MTQTVKQDDLMQNKNTHLDWAMAFTQKVCEHFKGSLVSIVLYGSVACGRERSDSDIDLLIVMKNLKGGNYRRRTQFDPLFEEWFREHENPPFISTLLKTPEEAQRFSPLYLDMTDRHKILWDKDEFFKKILEDIRTRLSRLGAVRRRMGKVEYWDLKPDYRPGEVFEI